MERKQYFIYGILVSYKDYLDLDVFQTVDDVLEDDDAIQGIFTGRGGDFMIVGRVLETYEDDGNQPHPVPLLAEVDMQIIRNEVLDQYNLTGEFHYYFITKVNK